MVKKAKRRWNEVLKIRQEKENRGKCNNSNKTHDNSNQAHDNSNKRHNNFQQTRQDKTNETRDTNETRQNATDGIMKNEAQSNQSDRETNWHIHVFASLAQGLSPLVQG